MADERQVRLVRSGGFAGLKMSASTAVDELPSAAKAALADAPPAVRAKVADVPSTTRGGGGPGADRFQYELTIPTGPRRTRTYRFAEGATPDGLESIVGALTEQLRPGVR